LQVKSFFNRRKRKLASIGTYDYDTLSGPIVYEALPPDSFKFTPLSRKEVKTGREVIQLLKVIKYVKQDRSKTQRILLTY
jgi:phenylalanyl-tRNA synthetase beta chain